MKTVLAAVFVASLACAQENLPDPAPIGQSEPLPRPVAVTPPPRPAIVPEATPKPVLKATPPTPAEVPVPAEPILAPLSSKDAADTLSPNDLKLIVDLLRENYIRPDALADDALARAGVQGLLDRLGAGARIFPKRMEQNETASPFRYELLSANVGYVRLGALTFGNLALLDKALHDQTAKPPGAMVLDLRASPPNADFEFAAEVCRRFCPRGRILFSIKRPKANDEEILTSRDDPRWRGLLVVLVDGDTAGTGEVIAAVLRTHLRAYVVGQKTQGEAAQFEELPLAGGKVLRVAIGEVTLPDNSPVFPGGLQSDLVVPLTQDKTDAMLAAGLTDGISAVVEENERPRMNEAALVAGTNPELDAVQLQQQRRTRGEQAKIVPRDIVLQRALDYITTISIYEAAQPRRR